jgi:hypothetical protein
MVLIALALAALEPAPPPAQSMEVEIARDAMSDQLRATATLRSTGERIVIRCRAPDWGDVHVEYHSRRWLARGQFLTGQTPVTYRFDGQRPVRKLWHVNDRTASFDDRGRTIRFLRALMGARRLVIRMRDIENHRFDTIFTIGDSAAAITRLLQTCGSSRINPRVLPRP